MKAIFAIASLVLGFGALTTSYFIAISPQEQILKVIPTAPSSTKTLLVRSAPAHLAAERDETARDTVHSTSEVERSREIDLMLDPTESTLEERATALESLLSSPTANRAEIEALAQHWIQRIENSKDRRVIKLLSADLSLIFTIWAHETPVLVADAYHRTNSLAVKTTASLALESDFQLQGMNPIESQAALNSLGVRPIAHNELKPLKVSEIAQLKEKLR